MLFTCLVVYITLALVHWPVLCKLLMCFYACIDSALVILPAFDNHATRTS